MAPDITAQDPGARNARASLNTISRGARRAARPAQMPLTQPRAAGRAIPCVNTQQRAVPAHVVRPLLLPLVWLAGEIELAPAALDELADQPRASDGRDAVFAPLLDVARLEIVVSGPPTMTPRLYASAAPSRRRKDRCSMPASRAPAHRSR